MVPGSDSMGAPNSFTVRRPNASHLPPFELPPPPPGFSKYANANGFPTTTQPTPTSLTSVGNLLTPPSNSSADGISPSTSSMSTYSQYQQMNSQQAFGPGRAIFSPSLNSIVRGHNPPSSSESLPPPPYELAHYQTSMSMSAPSLQTLPAQQQMMSSSMSAQTPVSASVTQPSPVHAQEAFRPPPTPTYYGGSQPSSTPQQTNFPSYTTGPSPVQQSPVSAGGHMQRVSPVNGTGSVPPLGPPQYPQHRQYSYSMPAQGPVLSNVNNPSGQLALVGGMPHGMMQGFNSGHAAQYGQMYGQPQAHHPQNDRPFRCDQCPQSFNRNHDLKRHKRIHLAVKPFPCGHCDKSFSRKDALKRHVLVKGCGKAGAEATIKEIKSGSLTPEMKSESALTSPTIAALA